MSDVRIFGGKLFMLKNGIQFRHDIQTKLVSSTQRDTLLGVFAKLRKASISFARNSMALTGRIFMKFDNWVFFRKSVEKIKV
jgi:hypothetical protein